MLLIPILFLNDSVHLNLARMRRLPRFGIGLIDAGSESTLNKTLCCRSVHLVFAAIEPITSISFQNILTTVATIFWTLKQRYAQLFLVLSMSKLAIHPTHCPQRTWFYTVGNWIWRPSFEDIADHSLILPAWTYCFFLSKFCSIRWGCARFWNETGQKQIIIWAS